MKHLLLIAAAIAALATTLPAGELAMAQGRGQSHDRGRGPPDRGDERRWDEGRRAEERRDDGPPRGRRSLREEDYRREEGGRPRYEDGPPPPDARPARRGGYLPDNYRGGVVDDYQRLRLRPPPRGYAWVRVNDGYALVSVADGRVFDVIPD